MIQLARLLAFGLLNVKAFGFAACLSLELGILRGWQIEEREKEASPLDVGVA